MHCIGWFNVHTVECITLILYSVCPFKSLWYQWWRLQNSKVCPRSRFVSYMQAKQNCVWMCTSFTLSLPKLSRVSSLRLSLNASTMLKRNEAECRKITTIMVWEEFLETPLSYFCPSSSLFSHCGLWTLCCSCFCVAGKGQVVLAGAYLEVLSSGRGESRRMEVTV